MNPDTPELLLFDDEPNTAEIVQDTLEPTFKVEYCSTEPQLRDAIDPERFCVIVCDVNIQSSKKAGYEIIDEIREEYKIKEIPVGVYSAVRDIPEIKKNQAKYFEFYIDKSGGQWGDKLLAECIKACGKKRRLVFADVAETQLKSLKIDLSEPLDVTKSPDSEVMGVKGGENITLQIALEQLRQKQLDEGTEYVYKQVIEAKLKEILERR